MTGVDVLAVMDRGIEELSTGHSTMWTAKDVRVMRAAVAELIQLTSDYRAIEKMGSRHNDEWAAICDRYGIDKTAYFYVAHRILGAAIDVALARVGGAP